MGADAFVFIALRNGLANLCTTPIIPSVVRDDRMRAVKTFLRAEMDRPVL
jgi:hypothetical protein